MGTARKTLNRYPNYYIDLLYKVQRDRKVFIAVGELNRAKRLRNIFYGLRHTLYSQPHAYPELTEFVKTLSFQIKLSDGVDSKLPLANPIYLLYITVHDPSKRTSGHRAQQEQYPDLLTAITPPRMF